MRGFLLVGLAAALLSASCGHRDERQIRRAAQGYLDATANYRIDEAMPYAVPEMQKGAFPFMKAMAARVDTAYILSNTPATVRITAVGIHEDDSTATVTYHKTTPIKQVESSLPLVRRHGQWLVKRLVSIPPILQQYAEGHDTIRIDTAAMRRRFQGQLRRVPAPAQNPQPTQP